VVPATYGATIDQSRELVLGQESVDKAHATKILDVAASEVQRLQYPVLLGVAISIFDGSESMDDVLDAVDNGTGEVGGSVDLPCHSSTVKRGLVRPRLARGGYNAAMYDWVS
jgi:hypothetical protein